jgi:tetratricopeptide (TPR) repeat protein
MDLQDFEGQSMYFDDPIPELAEQLIQQAADLYGEEGAEKCLLKAYFLAPANLTILVALYRYYYYQHKYKDAILVAYRAMEVSATRLKLPEKWQDLKLTHLGEGAVISMGLLRFYLMALKGAGYLYLRDGNFEAGANMLAKVVEVDPQDRLRAAFLLDIALEALNLESGENVRSIRGYEKSTV